MSLLGEALLLYRPLENPNRTWASETGRQSTSFYELPGEKGKNEEGKIGKEALRGQAVYKKSSHNWPGLEEGRKKETWWSLELRRERGKTSSPRKAGGRRERGFADQIAPRCLK